MKGNRVIFAGARPGDSELITIKVKKDLEAVDFIIHAGYLASEAVCTERVRKLKHNHVLISIFKQLLIP
jgi:precorrin-4 methylase